MGRMTVTTTAVLLGTFATTASATGWEWPETFAPQQWTTPIEDWALDVSNDPNLTRSELVSTVEGPPEEPWCNGYAPPPLPQECDLYLNDLDWWIVDLNGLNGPEDIAPGTPIMPAPQGCNLSCLN